MATRTGGWSAGDDIRKWYLGGEHSGLNPMMLAYLETQSGAANCLEVSRNVVTKRH